MWSHKIWERFQNMKIWGRVCWKQIQTPTCEITFQCLNLVWSWSNFQDHFIIINQDAIWCQTWPHPSSLRSGTQNILQVSDKPFSKLNQINSQFLTKLVNSTKLSPPWSTFCLEPILKLNKKSILSKSLAKLSLLYLWLGTQEDFLKENVKHAKLCWNKTRGL